MIRNPENSLPDVGRRRVRGSVVVLILLACVVVVSSAAHLAEIEWRGADAAPLDATPEAPAPLDLIIPSELAIHPDHVYRRFLSTRAAVPDMRTLETVRRFQDLLSLFSLRQSTDDNFTLRVIDGRTGGLLQLYTLDSLRNENRSSYDWEDIDRIRRRLTTRLVDLHEASGMDRRDITVKWGRRNQVLEAREHETPFIEHEINLARMLNLSLLATEIGTVETFNRDRVVSRVGARSRYQLMPSALRDLDVNHYTLQTATGRHVNVREEWHPLIALEAAFIVARAYSNAMGHEIPGLSAYHTGPYNVFRVFREYLTEDTTLFTGNSNVVNAYQWGLTEGFDAVSAHTSFGTASRGYLPSLYGAMKATEQTPIDTSLTQLVERVSVKRGSSLLLTQLLDSIDTLVPDLDWRATGDDSTTYQRFRRINPHINLVDQRNPESVPVEANVRFVSHARSAAVRFFVPRGTTAGFARAGFFPFEDDETLSYDRETFSIDTDDLLDVDVEYENLVSDVSRFGFTEANRARLDTIYAAMQTAYEADPAYHRYVAREVARLHRWVWRSRNFDALALEVERARARVTVPPMPPAPLPSRLGAQPLRDVPSRPTLSR